MALQEPVTFNQKTDIANGNTDQVPPVFGRNNAFPIDNGTRLTPLVNGQTAFGRLAEELKKAKKSIRIAIWGLDPNLALVRTENGDFDPGDVLGNILKAKAQEGVIVKILVWDAGLVGGYGSGSGGDSTMDKPNPDSLMALKKEMADDIVRENPRAHRTTQFFNMQLRFIKVSGKNNFPSFHQKHVIIDLETAQKAVSFVMGHNLLPPYYDTNDHKVTDPKRQQTSLDGQTAKKAENIGPRHDVSWLAKGSITVDVYANFYRAWRQAGGRDSPNPSSLVRARYAVRDDEPGDGSGDEAKASYPVQLLATYNLDGKDEHTIREFYFNAITNARNYVYMENQYLRDTAFLKEIFEAFKKNGREAKLKEIVFIIVSNDFQSDFFQGAVGYEADCAKLFKEYGTRHLLLQMRTKEWPYDPVYVHAKVLIVDDAYVTAGSANFNERSQKHDPELNIAAHAKHLAKEMRRELWGICIGDRMDNIIEDPDSIFERWQTKVKQNDAIYQPVADANKELKNLESMKQMSAGDAGTGNIIDNELDNTKQNLAKIKQQGKKIPNGHAVTYKPEHDPIIKTLPPGTVQKDNPATSEGVA